MDTDESDRLAALQERWIRLRDAEREERKFNVNEPRIPKGQAGGGKWFTLEVIKGALGWARPPKGSSTGTTTPHTPHSPAGKAGGVLEKVAKEITAAEARGNSRPVSPEEFQHVAGKGKEMLDKMRDNSSPIKGLDERWDKVKVETYREVRQSWGGATINAHTGIPLASNADRYALSVKDEHMDTVSIHETVSSTEFSQAMDQAKEQFRGVLENDSHYLGVFHDDDNHRIDIDPVVVVENLNQVEAIGAYTHAIGGAYHFASGDGFWPPHVVEQGLVGVGRSEDIKLGDRVKWKGPGQWRSYADKVQRGK